MTTKTSDKLIFVHIPKTAGSTFHLILNKRYAPKETCNLFGAKYQDPEIKKFIDAPIEGKEHIRLLKGHMPFGLHAYLPGNANYISILRDPVERVVSQYYYIKKNQRNPLHSQVEGGDMSIEEFVSSGIAIGMNNGQCRFLNGDLAEYAFNRCDDSLLTKVKTNITQRFIWLGITERFDESIFMLSKLMGWQTPPYYIRENVSKVRKSIREVDESAIRIIEAYNTLDKRLYEYANSLLDEAIAGYEGFYSELEKFQKANEKKQRRWGWLPDQYRKLVI